MKVLESASEGRPSFCNRDTCQTGTGTGPGTGTIRVTRARARDWERNRDRDSDWDMSLYRNSDMASDWDMSLYRDSDSDRSMTGKRDQNITVTGTMTWTMTWTMTARVSVTGSGTAKAGNDVCAAIAASPECAAHHRIQRSHGYKCMYSTTASCTAARIAAASLPQMACRAAAG
jgi:hypothetical protein